MLLVCSPSNPTGSMYSPEELAALADVVIERNLTVVSDEIYERLVYGDHKFASFATVRPGLQERTIIVNGVSKAYAMTGWRIGWTLSPANVAKAMADLQSQETSNPSSISQYAALAAVDGPQQCVDQMLAEFAKRREFVRERIASIPGLSCPDMGGAFYAFINIKEHLGRNYGGTRVDNSTAVVPDAARAAERRHGDGLGLRRRRLRPHLVRHEPGHAEGRLRSHRSVRHRQVGASGRYERVPRPLRVHSLFSCGGTPRGRLLEVARFPNASVESPPRMAYDTPHRRLRGFEYEPKSLPITIGGRDRLRCE